MASSNRGIAGRVIAGISRLRVTQGEGAGGYFAPAPWQRRFIRGALVPGRASAALSVARGNGKTTLVAAIAVAALAGPLARPRGETVLVASSYTQARIAFEHVLAFMRGAIERDARWRVQNSGNVASVEDRRTGSRLRAIGSDPRRAHGLAPVLVICDEPAQWPPSTSDRMRSALATSLGKIEGSRIWSIGTLPDAEEHWFRRAFNPPSEGGADYSQLHRAPLDMDPLDRRGWRKANPMFDLMPTLRAQIENEASGIELDPGLAAAFRALRLNGGTSDETRAMLIDAGLWLRHEVEDFVVEDAPPVWGIDLGGTAAFSAVAAYWPGSGQLAALAAIGDDPPPAERGLRDGVGRLYQELVDEGSLLLHRGRTVDVSILLAQAERRFGAPMAIASDRWREGELRDGLDGAAIPRSCLLELRGQGFKDGGEDVRAFRRSVAEGRVRGVRSRLLRSALSEAVTISDPSANSKLAKGSEGGRRTRARDDVAAAAILAVSLGVRRVHAGPARSFYRGTA